MEELRPFSIENSQFKSEILEYLERGGTITVLPPQDNPTLVTAQVRVQEKEEDEIYLVEGWNILNPDGSGFIPRERQPDNDSG